MRVFGIGLVAALLASAGAGCALQTGSGGTDGTGGTPSGEVSTGTNAGTWEGSSTVLATGHGQGANAASSGPDDHPDPQPWAPPMPPSPGAGGDPGSSGHPDPAPWSGQPWDTVTDSSGSTKAPPPGTASRQQSGGPHHLPVVVP